MAPQSSNVVLMLFLHAMFQSTASFLFQTPTPTIRIGGRSKRLLASEEQEPLLCKPKIAIVGSGAVGGYYGARLWESGAYDVKFQMRGDHYEMSTQNGLNVTSVQGDIFIPPSELEAYTDTNDMGKVDWVVVALKSSALESIPALISPLLEPGKTRVLAIMNGLIEDDLMKLLKEFTGEDQSSKYVECCAAVYGGMALVCSNRLAPGRIDHSYAGLLSGGVAAHSTDVTAEDNQHAFEQLWDPVKIDTIFEPSILSGRWRKVRSERS